MQRVKLNTGASIPLVGLGMYKVRGHDTVCSVLEAALLAGYRLFDTASVYRNEQDIGESLKILLPKLGLRRDDIFITSKLAPRDQGTSACRAACLQSIERLQCSYLDLFLIHWPGTQKLQPSDSRHRQNRMGSWADMEQLLTEGHVKAIGVSNYLERHLEDLLASSSTIPAVLQTEFHPHLIQQDELNWRNKHGVHFQAYSSLGTSSADNKVLSDPVVVKIAGDIGRTPAQVLLKWAVQQNIGVLPKSTNPDHIRENINIFDFTLSDKHMEQLSSLHSGTHYCWDPVSVL